MGSTLRQALYALFCIAGLVLTWHQNLAWLAEKQGSIHWALVSWDFGRDAFFGAHITASLAWDALICELTGVVWAAHESRRIGMHRWWGVWFFLLATFIAVSFALGLFLLFRERHLNAQTVHPTAAPA